MYFPTVLMISLVASAQGANIPQRVNIHAERADMYAALTERANLLDERALLVERAPVLNLTVVNAALAKVLTDLITLNLLVSPSNLLT